MGAHKNPYLSYFLMLCSHSMCCSPPSSNRRCRHFTRTDNRPSERHNRKEPKGNKPPVSTEKKKNDS